MRPLLKSVEMRWFERLGPSSPVGEGAWTSPWSVMRPRPRELGRPPPTSLGPCARSLMF